MGNISFHTALLSYPAVSSEKLGLQFQYQLPYCSSFLSCSQFRKTRCKISISASILLFFLILQSVQKNSVYNFNISFHTALLSYPAVSSEKLGVKFQYQLPYCSSFLSCSQFRKTRCIISISASILLFFLILQSVQKNSVYNFNISFHTALLSYPA